MVGSGRKTTSTAFLSSALMPGAPPPGVSGVAHPLLGGAHLVVDAAHRIARDVTDGVEAGDSVAWTNASSMRHTASGDGWSTGDIKPNTTSQPLAFKQAGTFNYGCDYHAEMSGTVKVAEGPLFEVTTTLALGAPATS